MVQYGVVFFWLLDRIFLTDVFFVASAGMVQLFWTGLVFLASAAMLMLDRSAMMHASHAGPSGWGVASHRVSTRISQGLFDLHTGSSIYQTFCVLTQRKTFMF